MGKIQTLIHEETICPVADRNANVLRVYRAPNGEATIHFRNLKIVLHTPQEIEEWKNGFTQALQKLQEKDYFRDDL